MWPRYVSGLACRCAGPTSRLGPREVRPARVKPVLGGGGVRARVFESGRVSECARTDNQRPLLGAPTRRQWRAV
jgi:hypothetical protein